MCRVSRLRRSQVPTVVLSLQTPKESLGVALRFETTDESTSSFSHFSFVDTNLLESAGTSLSGFTSSD